MAAESTGTGSSENKRYAVVTGGNKGIGLEISKQLACRGVTVVLTARDQQRGTEAVDKLKLLGLDLVFHQLDVLDAASIVSLADFIKTQFGRLDILVNNAAMTGIIIDGDAITNEDGVTIHWEKTGQTFELAVKCLKTNYYGVKNITEVLLPLLHRSESPRIVNVSSDVGQLKHISSEWALGVLTDVENLTEERLDKLLERFLNDFKEGLLETEGWPINLSAYFVSKATLNAFTRLLAKRYPRFCINCVHPGYVKTDTTMNTGIFTAEEGALGPVRVVPLVCSSFPVENLRFR